MAGERLRQADKKRAMQREQRGGHQHGEQRQDEEIDRQREERDAVEVDGHGQGHGQLDHAGDDDQLDDAQRSGW